MNTLFPGEVLITEKDKELILSHLEEINSILGKYPNVSENSEWTTIMSRVKGFAFNLTYWSSYLETTK